MSELENILQQLKEKKKNPTDRVAQLILNELVGEVKEPQLKGKGAHEILNYLKAKKETPTEQLVELLNGELKGKLKKMLSGKDGKTPTKSELVKLIKEQLPNNKEIEKLIKNLMPKETDIINDVMKQIPKPEDGRTPIHIGKKTPVKPQVGDLWIQF